MKAKAFSHAKNKFMNKILSFFFLVSSFSSLNALASEELPVWVEPNTKIAALEEIKTFSPTYTILNMTKKEITRPSGVTGFEVVSYFNNDKNQLFIFKTNCWPSHERLICQFTLYNSDHLVTKDYGKEVPRID